MIQMATRRFCVCRKSFFTGERILRSAVWSGAALTVGAVLCVILFVLVRGIPCLSIERLTDGYSLLPGSEKTGLLPMLLNTLYTVAVTLFFAIPPGVGCAVYLACYAGNGAFPEMIRFSVGVLSGFPSVLFGLFGCTVFCSALGLQTSLLAGCLTMALCVLPTIVRTAEEALSAVPEELEEGALALGAGKAAVIRTILLPGALPGILTGVSLSAGKIIGESAVFLFTAGFSYQMPRGVVSHLLESGRTLTLHLYQLARESGSEEATQGAFAAAAVLLILIFLLNRLTGLCRRMGKRRR